MEAFNADHGTYVGATSAALQASYDAGIKHINTKSLTATGYCIESTVGPSSYHKAGPGSDIVSGLCP
jgi:hypothetical protein